MEVNAVDFVHYSVSDLAELLPFYRDTLGLHLELVDEEAGWAEFAVPPTTLVLLEVNENAPLPPGPGGVALSISVDDVNRATSELRDAGGSILEEPFVDEACDMAIVADPDGNPLVLHRRHDDTCGRKEPFR